MDPIERHLIDTVGISITGHRDLFDLSHHFGRAPGAWTHLDASLRGDLISRLEWSRYNALFYFARARYLCIDEFGPLINISESPDGRIHFRRISVLFDSFRNIGTLLDTLADEANVIYSFGIPKEKVTSTYLRAEMRRINSRGTYNNPQQQNFISSILPMLDSQDMKRILEFRHIATHRPKLRRISGDGKSMFLPVDPSLDPDDDSAWNASAFMPKDTPADVDLNKMLSYVVDLMHLWYKLCNQDFEALYVR